MLSGIATKGQTDRIAQLKSALDTLDQDSLRVLTYSDLCYDFLSVSIDSAFQYGSKATSLADEMQWNKGMARSWTDFGYVFYFQSDYDSAIISWETALRHWTALKDTANIGSIFIKLGAVSFQKGAFDEALDYQLEALKIAEAQRDTLAITSSLNNIAGIHENTNSFETALSYYQRSITLKEAIGDFYNLSASQLNVANIFYRQEQVDTAILILEKTITLLDTHGYGESQYMAIGLNNMADYQASKNNYVVGLANAQRALQIREKLGDMQGIVSSLTSIASFHMFLKNYNDAERAMLKNLTLAKEKELTLEVSKLYQNLAKLYQEKNEPSKALEYTISYYTLEDSLKSRDRMETISALQTQYDTEKKEQQLALKEAQISEQTAQLRVNRILLIASLVLVVAIVLIALLNRNRLKKKQQLEIQEERLLAREAQINATITSQEKERARYARDLHDGFGQMISILNMNLGSLQKDSKPAERQQVFSESEKVINEMYDELKAICFDLMPQTLVRNGLQSGLTEFAERINKAGKVLVETNFFGLEERLEEIQEISLYRISQEWINNILKYSNAGGITLQITKDDKEITMLIEDDGSGFDKSKLLSSKGNGWKNLNTRTNLIQGSLELETVQGKKGNTLIINAPSDLARVDRTENTSLTV